MKSNGSGIGTSGLTALAALVALAAGPAARAADPAITPGAWDQSAANSAKRSALHPRLANTPAAAKYPRETLRAAGPTTTPFQPGRPRAIGDLSYQGGATVDHAQSHAVYVLNKSINCATPACWGNPESFLQDLGRSDFIHIMDQYSGRRDDNRYTNGGHASICFGATCTPPPVKLTDSNILAVVHAVAAQTHQTGYNHVYHVFLPPGTDECFDNTFSVCYSPDNGNTFFFCAYHGSVDFSDLGHVLYSVEPYQNVDGCNVAPGSPNGQLVDSTASVLSHELFETLTDPDGDGWWNTASNDMFGDEIADECSFVIFLPAGVFFDPPAFSINGHRYAVQSEYTNSEHACTTEP